MSNNSTQPVLRYIQEPFVSVAVRYALQAVVILVAIVGNAVVIRAVRRICGKKPLGYTLVLNLAVGELAQGLIYPFLLHYEATWDWKFGRFLCKVINPLLIICITNITLTIAAIAVYRWRLIVSPCSARSLTPIQTDLLIGSFWAIGLLVALPSALTRNTYLETRVPGELTGCGEHWHSVSAHLTYLCVFFAVVYVIPILVMVISYAMVGCKVRRHMVDTRRKSRQETSGSVITCHSEMESRDVIENYNVQARTIPMTPVGNGTTNPNSVEKSARQSEVGIVEMEQDLLKMIYLIVFSFIVCYIPYQVFFLLHLLKVWQLWPYGAIVSAYFMLIITVPSALHPIIYGTKSRFCALAFSWLVKCRWRRSRNVDLGRDAENV